jgi:hypothetical protein
MNKPVKQQKKQAPQARSFQSNAMGQALNRAADKIKKPYVEAAKKPIPPAVNRLQKDGTDHINIHPHARTRIGEALSTVGNIEFRHPQYGKFSNVIGLLMWLTSEEQPDTFRTTQGKDLLRLRNSLNKRVKIHNLRTITLQSTWRKIMASKKLADELKQTILNFDYYYYEKVEVGEPIRVRAEEYNWFVPAVEEMRKALIEEREPDFTPFLTQREIIQLRTAAEAAARDMGAVFGEVLKEEAGKRKQAKPKKVYEHKRGENPNIQIMDEAPYAHLQTAVVVPPTEVSDCSVVDYRTLNNPLTGQPYGDLALTKIDGTPRYGVDGKPIPDSPVLAAFDPAKVDAINAVLHADITKVQAGLAPEGSPVQLSTEQERITAALDSTMATTQSMADIIDAVSPVARPVIGTAIDTLSDDVTNVQKPIVNCAPMDYPLGTYDTSTVSE